MSEPRLDNTLKQHRERLGLSQQDLSALVGVSRQAIVAIEGGRQVPSTSLSLRLARALRCGVEDLFTLGGSEGLAVRLAPTALVPGAPTSGAGVPGGLASGGARVVLGMVDDKWVAHRLPLDGSVPADGILSAEVSGRTGVVRPLVDEGLLARNVIVAGCAPILGTLVQRVREHFADARATWLPTSSSRSLDLLADRLVHVAGLHMSGAGTPNVAAIRSRFPNDRMLLVNLTRWRQGLVVPRGNPLGIRTGAALLRPGLKFARREDGAGAQRLLTELLAHEGVERSRLPGPFAQDHHEVAQLVRSGAADVGVAIEAVALAAGLGFVPLDEERFDLVIPAALAEVPPVSRLIEALDDPGFRAEMASLPGYDFDLSGQVTTLEAA
jgi:molybdate-binding protein/DNA-binding XRE family transcriptional regulator